MSDVHQVVTVRMAELRSEFTAGEARLARLEAEQTTLRETLLRIDGALLALNELLPVTSGVASGIESGNGRPPQAQPVRQS